MARALPLQEQRFGAGDEDGVPGVRPGLNVFMRERTKARESRDQRMPPGRSTGLLC